MSQNQQMHDAPAEWTVIAPDGTRFTGPAPMKAALSASQYQLEIDPEAQKKFLRTIEAIRQEGAAERDECLNKFGTLDCPACHGSGHIADANAKVFAAVIFNDGCRLIVPFDELPDILPFEDYRRVENVIMTATQYDALPEFQG